MNVSGTELRVEIVALFFHRLTTIPSFRLSFMGTSMCTPLRVFQDVYSKLLVPRLGWTLAVLIIVCYANTQGSCDSLHSISQPVLCKFHWFGLYNFLCDHYWGCLSVSEEEMKIWCHRNWGSTAFVRKWSFLLPLSLSSSSVLSICS